MIKTWSTRLGYGEDDMAAKIASFVAQQLAAGGVRWCWVRPRQVEIGTPMMDVTNKLPLRLRAVGWAAAVALLPAYVSARYVVDTKTAEHSGFLGLTNVPALTAMAVVAAVIPSYFVCWRLLDYEQYHHGPTAAGIGTLTCLLAYLLLACMVVSIDLVLGAQAGYLADESPSGLVCLVAVGLFVFLYGSLVITGWFTLPLSALVAYLVSLMYRGGG